MGCEKSNDAVIQQQFEDAQKGCAQGCPFSIEGCLIKGNISGEGRRFYILPGDTRYDLAIVDATKGEAWFCTADEALNNGFKPVPPGI